MPSVTAVVHEPGRVMITISMTMALRDWKDLRAQLDGAKWPSSDLARELNSVIYGVEKTFYPSDGKEVP